MCNKVYLIIMEDYYSIESNTSYLGVYSDLETAKKQIDLFDPFTMNNKKRGAEIKEEINDFLVYSIDKAIKSGFKIKYDFLLKILNNQFGKNYYFYIYELYYDTLITSIPLEDDFSILSFDDIVYSKCKSLEYDFKGNYTFEKVDL